MRLSRATKEGEEEVQKLVAEQFERLGHRFLGPEIGSVIQVPATDLGKVWQLEDVSAFPLGR